VQVYEKLITVVNDDLDDLNHVNNVRYVQWVNDIAEQHWNTKAIEQITATYFWVLINHHIQYKGQAVLGDELLLKTFVTKTEGVTSTRMVEIYNKNSGKLLTTSKTNWCFMSKASNRPARIPQEIFELFD
jgi:acyl-CoA thioester hydrolase